MMYLGTLGRMVAIECPTAQRVTSTDRYSFHTTLGGTVKAQSGPMGRRTWDISLGQLTTPSDVGTVMDFSTGVWGPGPFWFVPTDAPVVNLLTPDAASCDPQSLILSDGAELLGSPPMSLGDNGFAARSVWKNGIGSVTFGAPVPVVSGKPVTGSAWVVGAGRVRLIFVDGNGAVLSFVESEPSGWSDPSRVSVSARTPRNAAGVQVAIVGAITQAARPAITWTDTLFEWGDGQGCAKAVLHDASRDVVRALPTPYAGKWSSMSFTIQEVG